MDYLALPRRSKLGIESSSHEMEVIESEMFGLVLLDKKCVGKLYCNVAGFYTRAVSHPCFTCCHNFFFREKYSILVQFLAYASITYQLNRTNMEKTFLYSQIDIQSVIGISTFCC